MAAQITSGPNQGNVRKPDLFSKLEGFNDDVNMAVFIPREDGVITVSDDKTLRVWLKRDTGQYWPSICHTLPSQAASLAYNEETRRTFIGLDNGTISEFNLAEDFNRMSQTRDYLAHQGRVTSLKFSLNCEWVLSCARDKYFQWHCSETGRRLGGYQASAWCLCLEFDEQSKYVFVGDYSGQISVLRISNTEFSLIVTLKGHSGSVRSLAWDAERSLLFSGSFDESVIVWDIGSKQGTAFELQGHHDKVQALAYASGSKQLLSGSDDAILGIWNMDVKRTETPSWEESDVCQKCNSPFFWNFRRMWEEKTIGIRQHHCRKCGKAVCNKCSAKKSTIPPLGYEYEVRVCDDCFSSISEEEKAPLATFHDVRHQILYMNLDQTRKRLLTVGRDRVVKLWDVSTSDEVCCPQLPNGEVEVWASAIVNFQYPSSNPCIIFDASLQISIVGVFKPNPQVKQVSLDNKAVVLNSTASYCDNGNSSSLDFFMEGGVGFTVTFLKQNDTVKMMPSITFVPAIIFNSFSNDTSQVALKGTKGKLLPPSNVSYSCFTGDTPIVMTNGSSAGVSYHAIISITELQVQAFDIENGKLGPGESCDAVPIPSVAPIVTPKPGDPPVKTYSINNGKVDCIVLQAGIEFTIPYTSNGARLMKTVGVPDATQVTGICGEGVATIQSMSLMFYDDWLLNFILSHSASASHHLLMDGTTYGIKEISLEYNISSTLFPDADNTGEKMLAKHVFATPNFLTPVGSSYRCQANTNVDVQGIQTRLTSFQYLAFGTQNSTSFDPNAVTDCQSPSPSPEDNDYTGTIVGVIIAVFFIVMVFIGIILYMKKKGKGSYEQVY
ncbi:uncharacterized protein LOC133202951 [Saccostrea echinata]|uniref:uncharacterized protein LOC133202951 n=1 Tax=Saccostrea echinata TaxID=191078 RepID=UPI002A81AF36|nr:uncharacterized protein LOC133202951 [Saccostrea echinata]